MPRRILVQTEKRGHFLERKDFNAALMNKPLSSQDRGQCRVDLAGLVQGVGMRPFIARLAHRYQQNGWVANTPDGVSLVIAGEIDAQQAFLAALVSELPPFARIEQLTVTRQALQAWPGFHIKPSTAEGQPSPFVVPDMAVCADCLADLYHIASRFYRYPFTSCSHCGPRYSIMMSQPFDRARTSMAAFTPCPDCLRDYQDVANRRYHAQTLACPACGPRLVWQDASGTLAAEGESALQQAVMLLKQGGIVAVKGLGGFQLLAAANDSAAVLRLRVRKQRLLKPLALMVKDLAAAQTWVQLDAVEREVLGSAAAPIVLLTRQPHTSVAESVAPGIPWLGVMRAYTPLHHLLLDALGGAVVATSGNRLDEPICIDNAQALANLAGIADGFLLHDRAILRPLDDSVVRVINGQATVLRRARGYVPLPLTVPEPLPDALAVGGQLKNTVALSLGKQLIVSQHLGDLSATATQQQHARTLIDLQQFYQHCPTLVLHDRHDGYHSSQAAQRWPGKKLAVPHHYAHALACLAEHGLSPPALAVVWDGAGLGDDGALWGGEFLLLHTKGYRRFAFLRPFPLPGGTQAILEPRRAALGLSYAMLGDAAFDCEGLPFSEPELALLQAALRNNVNCPLTSSAGRLFDAVASMLGICQINGYEGQAAMGLEALAGKGRAEKTYPFHIIAGSPLVIDWEPMLATLLGDMPGQPPALIAAQFHVSLAAMIVAVAQRAGESRVLLSGGCMQNACLVTAAARGLTQAGFDVYCQQSLPPNDGGLAIGQLYAAQFLE